MKHTFGKASSLFVASARLGKSPGSYNAAERYLLTIPTRQVGVRGSFNTLRGQRRSARVGRVQKRLLSFHGFRTVSDQKIGIVWGHEAAREASRGTLRDVSIQRKAEKKLGSRETSICPLLDSGLGIGLGLSRSTAEIPYRNVTSMRSSEWNTGYEAEQRTKRCIRSWV